MIKHRVKVYKKTTKERLFTVLTYPVNAIKNIGLKTRFSIAFRITLFNMRLLLQYSIFSLFIVIIGISFVYGRNIPFSHYLEFTRSVQINEQQKIEGFCLTENVSLGIYDRKNDLILDYSGFQNTRKYVPLPYVFRSTEQYYLSMPYIMKSMDQTYYTNMYKDITFYVSSALSILKILGISLLAMTGLIGYKSSKVSKSLLSPLQELSQTIKQVSESNMTSRINISDSKYELKDIAQSFNQMMDTIESSYQKQKQFVSDASHELRTPIAVIQGYANMLNRWGKDDPKILQESIDAIADETENMKDLVEKLLFIARSDKATFALEKTTFDLCSLVSDLVKEFTIIAPKKQFIFTPFYHPSIYADKNRIKEAYRIIMDNAVKYTGDNSVIKLSVFKEDQYACFAVSDKGPGIPKDELPLIFDRFFSRNRSSKDVESKSHGLGLALAKIIVLAHSGKITVKSLLGKGTEFIIKLPEN